jgi:hypothetical protein
MEMLREKLPNLSLDDLELPDFYMAFPNEIIVKDEINNIRNEDKKVQGITAEDEKLAKESIEANGENLFPACFTKVLQLRKMAEKY